MRTIPLYLCAACALLPGCARTPDGPILFEPVGVGFGFDGVLRSDGTLGGYDYGGEAREPVMVLVFVSESYFSTDNEQILFEQSCAAIAPFSQTPSVVPLPTDDDSALYWSYETALSFTSQSCAGRVDPERWGEEAEGLWGPFDGARFGYGFGLMTDALRATWTLETLETLGGAMVSSWVALEDDGQWLAADQTTGVLYAYNPVTGQVPTERDPYGNDVLLPISAASLAESGFPGAYVRSTPNVFVLDLTADQP